MSKQLGFQTEAKFWNEALSKITLQQKKQPKTHLPSLESHKIIIFENLPTSPWKLTATLMPLKLGSNCPKKEMHYLPVPSLVSFQVHLLLSFREAQITRKSLTWHAPQQMRSLEKVMFGIYSSVPPRKITWQSLENPPILDRRYIDSFMVGIIHSVMWVRHEKNPPYFPLNPACLIGILIMVYCNPHRSG